MVPLIPFLIMSFALAMERVEAIVPGRGPRPRSEPTA